MKPWAEIVDSEDYKSMSPKDQVEAKKEYFNLATSSANLSKDEMVEAQKYFFGGRLIDQVNPKEDVVPSVATEGLGYIKEHPFKSMLESPIKTLTGGTIQESIDQSIGGMKPFNQNYAMYGNNPISNAKAIAEGTMAGTMGGLADLATAPINKIAQAVSQSKIINSLKPVKDLKQFLNQKISKPRLMNDKWLMEQSNKIYSVADDVQTNIRGEYAKLYEGGLGSQKVPMDPLQKAANNVGEYSKQALEDMGKKIGQNAAPNIQTAKAMKDIIQDYIPDAVWMKGKKDIQLTPQQQKLVDSYFELRKIIYDNAGEFKNPLMELDKKATEAYRVSKAVKRLVVDETGKPNNTSQLVNIFSNNAGKAGKRELINRLNKLDNKAQDVITNMNKFKFRQELKKIIAPAVGVAGAAGLIKKAIEEAGK